MKFFMQFIGEESSVEITEKEYKKNLSGYYYDTKCFIDPYYGKNNPIRTPFAWFYCEK